jgi:hypothetical protein
MQDQFQTQKQTIISTAVPMQTRTYKPIAHEQLIDLTLNAIDRAGFTLGTESYTSALNGNVANGRFTISSVADSEMQLEVGWQNSYDKSLTLKFAIGTRIMVCKNGCVSGDFGAFKHKHVGDIQTFTPETITNHILSAGDTFVQMQRDRDAMKEIVVSKRTTAELIGRMFIEEQFIAATQINIIKGQLKNPSFDYGADTDSLWQLYQHTTFAMKEVHPSEWMGNHIKAHNFFKSMI